MVLLRFSIILNYQYTKGRKCSSEHGCDSLYSGDMVTLENMPGNFVVTTYDNETLTYDPAI